MVPLSGVAVFGSHGVERSAVRAVPRKLRAIARRAARIAREATVWVREFAGVEIERKPFGLAFHHRTLDAGAWPRFRRRLRASLARADTLDSSSSRKARRRNAAGGLGKGWLRAGGRARARTQGTILVAIGDDRTDEDLFAALAGRA